MYELKEKEMKQIEGGANGIFVTAIITGIITFVTGILHGYSNPKKCNN